MTRWGISFFKFKFFGIDNFCPGKKVPAQTLAAAVTVCGILPVKTPVASGTDGKTIPVKCHYYFCHGPGHPIRYGLGNQME